MLFNRTQILRSADDPAASEGSRSLGSRWRVLAICIALAAITWSVFGQTLRYEFVNYDDNEYVYENPVVVRGLDLQGIKWAFTHVDANYWNPLTVISHMFDCQLYGLNAGGHHLTNVLLHTVTVILLFIVFWQMTGAAWPSAFAAAVFAIHPLRVESVAWVAERKDVLSGLFFMLTIWAYVSYCRHPWSFFRYGLVLLSFALGLMCKAILVTLPFILLILDYWPLNRLLTNGAHQSGFQLFRLIPRRLILEKMPLFALAVASASVTLFTFAPLQVVDEHFFLSRVGNASILYLIYIGKMFWPSNLAVLYIFDPREVTATSAVLSFLTLVGISAAASAYRRRHPYFLVGWFWYLLILVPVIGILKLGAYAQADRYTYLPQIGLCFALTWAAKILFDRLRKWRAVLGGLALVVLVALMVTARVQARYWKDSETLWRRSLECTSNNSIAHNNLGHALAIKNQFEEAIFHFQRALQISPDSAEAHINFGNVLFKQGNVDDAIAHYQQALRIKPDHIGVHFNLGKVLVRKGDFHDAISHYEHALKINPKLASAHNGLGEALLQERKVDNAIHHFQTALQLKSDYLEARYNLGNAFLQKNDTDRALECFQEVLQLNPNKPDANNSIADILDRKGRMDEAIMHYQRALIIEPDNAQALNNLAWIRATHTGDNARNGLEAVSLAERACRATDNKVPVLIGTLAAAYAEAGRFDEAIATAEKAHSLALTLGHNETAEKNKELIELFKARKPYREVVR